MDYEGGDLLAGWRSSSGYWVTAQGCVCRLGGDLNCGLAGQFQSRMLVRGAWCMKRAI